LDSKGVSKIYVSHDLSSIQLICKKALYFSKGSIKYQGNVKEVINDFRKDVLRDGKSSDSSARYGTNDLKINSVELLDHCGNRRDIFKRGEPFIIKINYASRMTIKNPEFFIGFYSEDGNLISAPNTRDHGVPIQLDVGEGEIEYRMESLPLNIGKYILTIGCWDETGHVAFDHHGK
jgi:ABC-type glutathione transport system ATPase component